MMIDSTNIAFMVDTLNYESCIQNHAMLKDFKFVAEKLPSFEGPMEREVTYISATWNFIVFFVVLILIVVNKMLSQRKYIASAFQSRTGDRAVRESNSLVGVQSLFVIISFALMISMLVQKIFLIYGENYILHSKFDFFVDILLSVLTIFILNHLLISLYGWLFETENLIFFYISSHVSAMSNCNFFLMPIIMLLFFHPYRFFLIIAAVITLVFYVIHSVKLLMETRMLLKINFVNIFLYLCTVEILPVLVIFRLIVNII